ncbi:MAG: helix-turn-helix transcriptional regulator [Clostridia bacterium]|nr:helix-turn-helix transcriptional regulator [Clostridia bacterium]
MHLYRRLRDLREDCDKTQEEIAAQLQIQQTQYSRYERGDRELPMHHFITLARYYGISLDYLAGLIDTPRKLEP